MSEESLQWPRVDDLYDMVVGTGSWERAAPWVKEYVMAILKENAVAGGRLPYMELHMVWLHRNPDNAFHPIEAGDTAVLRTQVERIVLLAQDNRQPVKRMIEVKPMMGDGTPSGMWCWSVWGRGETDKKKDPIAQGVRPGKEAAWDELRRAVLKEDKAFDTPSTLVFDLDAAFPGLVGMTASIGESLTIDAPYSPPENPTAQALRAGAWMAETEHTARILVREAMDRGWKDEPSALEAPLRIAEVWDKAVDQATFNGWRRKWDGSLEWAREYVTDLVLHACSSGCFDYDTLHAKWETGMREAGWTSGFDWDPNTKQHPMIGRNNGALRVQADSVLFYVGKERTVGVEASPPPVQVETSPSVRVEVWQEIPGVWAWKIEDGGPEKSGSAPDRDTALRIAADLLKDNERIKDLKARALVAFDDFMGYGPMWLVQDKAGRLSLEGHGTQKAFICSSDTDEALIKHLLKLRGGLRTAANELLDAVRTWDGKPESESRLNAAVAAMKKELEK